MGPYQKIILIFFFAGINSIKRLLILSAKLLNSVECLSKLTSVFCQYYISFSLSIYCLYYNNLWTHLNIVKIKLFCLNTCIGNHCILHKRKLFLPRDKSFAYTLFRLILGWYFFLSLIYLTVHFFELGFCGYYKFHPIFRISLSSMF